MARPVVRHCFLRLDMPQHFLNLFQVSSTALRRSQEGQGLPRARHPKGRIVIRKMMAGSWLIIIWLVVDLPLWKIWKSDWIVIPTIVENKSHVPNHQTNEDFHESHMWISSHFNKRERDSATAEMGPNLFLPREDQHPNLQTIWMG